MDFRDVLEAGKYFGQNHLFLLIPFSAYLPCAVGKNIYRWLWKKGWNQSRFLILVTKADRLFGYSRSSFVIKKVDFPWLDQTVDSRRYLRKTIKALFTFRT